jgi:hypothetical protein
MHSPVTDHQQQQHITEENNSTREDHPVHQTIEELYENIWIDELKIYMKRLYSLIRVNNLIHPTIRNYNIIIRHMNKLQLVEIITDDTNRETCILHTYKINIFKRIWKKQFYNKLKNKIKYSKL